MRTICGALLFCLSASVLAQTRVSENINQQTVSGSEQILENLTPLKNLRPFKDHYHLRDNESRFDLAFKSYKIVFKASLELFSTSL